MSASECVACPAGTYKPYFKDFDASNTYGYGYGWSCTLCPKGKYRGQNDPQLYAWTDCYDCPAGYYAPSEGSLQCTACLPGSYSSQPGSQSCSSCPSGSYNPLYAATSCVACPLGTYMQALGAVADQCSSCPAGKYADAFGSTVCKVCNTMLL